MPEKRGAQGGKEIVTRGKGVGVSHTSERGKQKEEREGRKEGVFECLDTQRVVGRVA